MEMGNCGCLHTPTQVYTLRYLYTTSYNGKESLLSDFNNDLTPCVASQNFVVRAEHVVELIHGVDEWLYLAYKRGFELIRGSMFKPGATYHL